MSVYPLSQAALDRLLEGARAQMELDAETERDLLEELRGHLEDAYAAARARGLSHEEALAEVGRRAALDEAGRALQATHRGWGTADGVMAAAVPVVATLVLRWLIGRQVALVHVEQVLARPEFWGLAGATLTLPLIRFRRWRYALASWVFFWVLSLALVVQQVLVH